MISAGLPGDTLFGEIVISANNLSLLGGGWSIRLHQGSTGYADVIATLMSDDVIRIKTRVKYQGAWMPWRELANDYSIVNALREKAPDGYGLGGNAKLLTADDDLNTVLTTGWYNWSWAAHPQNAPDNNWREYGCAMHVFSTTPGGYAIQTVYDLSDDITHGCAIQRTIYILSSGNVYYPWEWVNPPMELGVEYRTTERYLGKPVYCQVIDCGVITTDTQKIVDKSIPVLDVLSCEGIIHTNSNGHNQATPFDYSDTNGTKYSVTVSAEAYKQSEIDRLTIYVNSSWTVTGSAHAIVRYTKETDQ